MPKPFLQKNNSGIFNPSAWGISSKVNVIAQLVFELAYYDLVDEDVCHYIMGIHP